MILLVTKLVLDAVIALLALGAMVIGCTLLMALDDGKRD